VFLVEFSSKGPSIEQPLYRERQKKPGTFEKTPTKI
jgi:hypothetical protein